MGYAEQAAATEEGARAVERIRLARAYLHSKRTPGTTGEAQDIIIEALRILES